MRDYGAKFRESLEKWGLWKLWKEVFSMSYASKTMEIFHQNYVPEINEVKLYAISSD
jgi:hypothetical protein